jgi:hypothetical protein
MISHKLKCIFIHIPRCAGTSVELALDARDWWLYTPQEKHLSASEAKIRYADFWDDYFKFSFVRNPWDLEVSWYCWKATKLKTKLKNMMPFEDYIEDVEVNTSAKVSEFMRDRSREHLWSDHGSCSKWLAVDGELGVDFVGRVENYDSDLQVVLSTLDTSPRVTTHENRSKGVVGAYYSLRTRDTVARRYADDLTQFGYSFTSSSWPTLTGLPALPPV